MIYKKSLSSIGFLNISIGSILLIGLCLGWLYFDEFFNKNDLLAFFSKISGLVLFIVALIFMLRGIGLVRLKGDWEISITKEAISWKVPETSSFLFFRSDDTFSMPLNEISKVQVDDGTQKGSENMKKIELVFIHGSGKKYTVSEESGINMNAVIKELKSHGVNIELLVGPAN